MERFTRIGCLKIGKGIYVNKTGGVALEQDGMYLVEPTKEELREIYGFLAAKKEMQKKVIGEK